jgi:hypothetical protein
MSLKFRQGVRVKACREQHLKQKKSKTCQIHTGKAYYQNLQHKILIGIGDKDVMVTLEETIEVYRKLPNAALVVLPNTQHPIEKVDLKRISGEIKNFFG